jgi:hypothetical protein
MEMDHWARVAGCVFTILFIAELWRQVSEEAVEIVIYLDDMVDVNNESVFVQAPMKMSQNIPKYHVKLVECEKERGSWRLSRRLYTVNVAGAQIFIIDSCEEWRLPCNLLRNLQRLS